VTHETDFLDLYRRLGLDPGCGLAELKQAYRRHVAALHPDRQQGRPADPRTASRLQRLNAQYTAAMEFHRRHGRLPGAPQTAAPEGRQLSDTAREMPDPFAQRRRQPFAASPWPSAAAPAARRPHARMALLLVIAALSVLGWTMHSASSSSSADDDSASQAGAGNVAQETQASAAVLQVGMSADEVRTVEGEPLATHGDLWEYGPSWIRFEHDEVIEWHSSPLRPLHTVAPGAGSTR